MPADPQKASPRLAKIAHRGYPSKEFARWAFDTRRFWRALSPDLFQVTPEYSKILPVVPGACPSFLDTPVCLHRKGGV